MLRDLPDQESAPPVYYLLAWVWGHVLGFGEGGLRSLSALAGTLTIPVAYAAATRLAGRRARGSRRGAGRGPPPAGLVLAGGARICARRPLRRAVAGGLPAGAGRPDGRAWAAWAVPAGARRGHALLRRVPRPGRGGLARLALPRDRRMALAAGGVAATALALAPLALAQRSTGNTAYIGEGSVSTRLVQVPKQLLSGYASPGQALSTALLAMLVVVAAARLEPCPTGPGAPACCSSRRSASRPSWCPSCSSSRAWTT